MKDCYLSQGHDDGEYDGSEGGDGEEDEELPGGRADGQQHAVEHEGWILRSAQNVNVKICYYINKFWHCTMYINKAYAKVL